MQKDISPQTIGPVLRLLKSNTCLIVALVFSQNQQKHHTKNKKVIQELFGVNYKLLIPARTYEKQL